MALRPSAGPHVADAPSSTVLSTRAAETIRAVRGRWSTAHLIHLEICAETRFLLLPTLILGPETWFLLLSARPASGKGLHPGAASSFVQRGGLDACWPPGHASAVQEVRYSGFITYLLYR